GSPHSHARAPRGIDPVAARCSLRRGRGPPLAVSTSDATSAPDSGGSAAIRGIEPRDQGSFKEGPPSRAFKRGAGSPIISADAMHALSRTGRDHSAETIHGSSDATDRERL